MAVEVPGYSFGMRLSIFIVSSKVNQFSSFMKSVLMLSGDGISSGVIVSKSNANFEK